MLLRKDGGAAVSRTERTEEVGSAAASCWATGPSCRRTMELVGREVMPAREARVRS
jgi:hypothetical protein